MSEHEIKQRQNYKRNRKKWIAVQTVAVILMFVLALLSFLTYDRMNRTYYIEYSESGSIDYKVQYKDNDFYEEEWIGAGQSYVTFLIKSMVADFTYKLNMDAANVGFEYTYEVVAQLIVSDKLTGDHIYDPAEVLVPETTGEVSGNGSFTLKQSVPIDFNKYNDKANSFIDIYELKSTSSILVVTMNVNVLSSSSELEKDSSNSYSTSLNIPLCEDNFSMHTTASSADGETKVLACKGAPNQDTFLVSAFVLGGIGLVLLFVLIVFIFATKNDDVTYSSKVEKIVRAYGSYIQGIEGEFDTAGYQIVVIKSFNEMLGIRDTIQSPILMSENRDQTKTQFLIPTNTKILYVFEIRVDNYDEIYARIESEKAALADELDIYDEPAEEAPEVVEEPIVEEVVEAEPEVVEEPVVEEVVEAEPEVVVVPANEEPAIEDTSSEDVIDEESGEIDDFDEDLLFGSGDEAIRLINGEIVHIRYRKSYKARLIQAGDALQRCYTEIKNAMLSYKGVKARDSFRCETFSKGRRQLAKLNVRGSTLLIYLALDPKAYDEAKYRHKDMSDKAQYEQVPMLIKVKSERSLKSALKLIREMMETLGIKAGTAQNKEYRMPYETTEALADQGLVRIIYPKGIVIDENTVIEKLNVNDLLRTLRAISPDENITIEQLVEEVLAEPDVELEEIDYVDEIDEEYIETVDHPGVEVIGVVWPERSRRNKIYRYDPNGETVHDGDIVLVPTRDAAKGREVIRKAAVVHGNHMIDPETHPHVLKKIIAILKRHHEN